MDPVSTILLMTPIIAFVLGIAVMIKLIVGLVGKRKTNVSQNSNNVAETKKTRRFDILLIVGLGLALVFVGQLAYVSWLIVFMGQQF